VRIANTYPPPSPAEVSIHLTGVLATHTFTDTVGSATLYNFKKQRLTDLKHN